MCDRLGYDGVTDYTRDPRLMSSPAPKPSEARLSGEAIRPDGAGRATTAGKSAREACGRHGRRRRARRATLAVEEVGASSKAREVGGGCEDAGDDDERERCEGTRSCG